MKPNQTTHQDELHDRIVQLRRDRDAHQMDESDYTDAILQLISDQVNEVLNRLEKQSRHLKANNFSGYAVSNTAIELERRKWRKK